jgi:hypothetical protein
VGQSSAQPVTQSPDSQLRELYQTRLSVQTGLDQSKMTDHILKTLPVGSGGAAGAPMSWSNRAKGNALLTVEGPWGCWGVAPLGNRLRPPRCLALTPGIEPDLITLPNRSARLYLRRRNLPPLQ